MQQASRALALESLWDITADGRVAPQLVGEWSRSSDGRVYRARLKDQLHFHNGGAVTAPLIRDAFLVQLPTLLGPRGAEVVESIEALRELTAQEGIFAGVSAGGAIVGGDHQEVLVDRGAARERERLRLAGADRPGDAVGATRDESLGSNNWAVDAARSANGFAGFSR